MLESNIDTVVLGCTHYPFVIDVIQAIVGEGVRVIDPAPAVARQVGRLLQSNERVSRGDGQGALQFFTSAEAASMETLLPKLLGEKGPVKTVAWEESALREPLLSGD
jgi:glutamate racemase